MTAVHFRFATDILRRLGEELNPSIDQGILELVKNSYDADARKCRIELIGTDRAGGTIHVHDDGNGLTTDDILNGWLVLGQSQKTRQRTRLGRIPAGNKGLGRLAALRLGRTAELSSRPYSERGRQYRVSVDWSLFDRAGLVDEVPLGIEEEAPPKWKAGADIWIRNLRSPVKRMDVKRLARALLLLADPFVDDPDAFAPVLSAPEFEDLERLVDNRYFEDADYHLIALLDDTGIANVRLVDWRGQLLFEGPHQEVAVDRQARPYKCPSAQFDLWAYLLTQTSFSQRATTLGEVREWLQAFGGVHLYLNGLRVAPYGNAGNDWLDMNLRRAQSPEERPSTNNSIGRVSLADAEGRLLEKTDRSGFVEADEFHELREFVQDALEWMARRRLEIAEERRQRTRQASQARAQQSRQQVETKIIQSARKEAQPQLLEVFQKYDESRDRQVRALRREVQLYRTLSTVGITAATFAHESSNNPLKVIDQAVKSIDFRGRRELGERYESVLLPPVDSVRRATESLGVLSQHTLRLIDHGKRRLASVDLHAVIEKVVGTYKPFLKAREVSLDLRLHASKPYLQGTEAAIESILTNLLNNSLAWFEAVPPQDRKILLTTDVLHSRSEMNFVLRVADNGPGIEGITVRDIWLPGRSSRSNGTGLGLTIVKDAVTDLGGRVHALEHGQLGGAEFTIQLPILGA